ncbi:hypothetical protein LEP1GSC021_0412 [Leptospira noguchii str. 1993005606]|nr:hypothetical protein LEP1GSC021_0412 [Leptospira noguchii str. 1993005606]
MMTVLQPVSKRIIERMKSKIIFLVIEIPEILFLNIESNSKSL